MCFIGRRVEFALHPGLREAAGPKPCLESRILSEDESNDLIVASAGNHDLHDTIVLALHAGLRMCELEQLRWSDIDMTTLS